MCPSSVLHWYHWERRALKSNSRLAAYRKEPEDCTDGGVGSHFRDIDTSCSFVSLAPPCIYGFIDKFRYALPEWLITPIPPYSCSRRGIKVALCFTPHGRESRRRHSVEEKCGRYYGILLGRSFVSENHVSCRYAFTIASTNMTLIQSLYQTTAESLAEVFMEIL